MKKLDVVCADCENIIISGQKMCNKNGRSVKSVRKGRPVLHRYCFRGSRFQITVKLSRISHGKTKRNSDNPQTVKHRVRKLRAKLQTR